MAVCLCVCVRVDVAACVMTWGLRALMQIVERSTPHHRQIGRVEGNGRDAPVRATCAMGVRCCTQADTRRVGDLLRKCLPRLQWAATDVRVWGGEGGRREQRETSSPSPHQHLCWPLYVCACVCVCVSRRHGAQKTAQRGCRSVDAPQMAALRCIEFFFSLVAFLQRARVEVVPRHDRLMLLNSSPRLVSPPPPPSHPRPKPTVTHTNKHKHTHTRAHKQISTSASTSRCSPPQTPFFFVSS